MKHDKKVVFVCGNLIFKSGYSWAKSLGAYWSEDMKSHAMEIIEGDLIITKDNKTKSFVEYFAQEDIIAYGIGNGDCRFLRYPQEIFNEYRENISLIEEFEKVHLNDNLAEIKFSQLFVSVISSLELFLAETMITLVLGYENYFQKFLQTHDEKIRLNEFIKFSSEPEQLVYDLIRNINCHQLDRVRRLFKTVFNLKLLSLGKLEKHIQIRHDLVHRNAHEKDGQKRKITKEDVDELVLLSNELVYFIADNLKDEFESWSVLKEKNMPQ